MSPETFYVCFCKVTKKELGRRINPHLTRKIVATGIAIARPELVRMVGSLLDQTTDQSAAYNLADQLSASRTYLDLLEMRRQQALKNLARSTGESTKEDATAEATQYLYEKLSGPYTMNIPVSPCTAGSAQLSNRRHRLIRSVIR